MRQSEIKKQIAEAQFQDIELTHYEEQCLNYERFMAEQERMNIEREIKESAFVS